MLDAQDHLDPNPHPYQSGLKITDLGLRGLVIEPTANFATAVSRHQTLVDRVDTEAELSPGAKLPLLLTVNEFILNFIRLKSAVSPGAKIYRDRETRYIEYELKHGWLDRRQLSAQTTKVIESNGGCVVTSGDWKDASEFLHAMRPQISPDLSWTGFLDDAQCWWLRYLPGPLFAYAVGGAPFQMLPRVALARAATGLPKKKARTGGADSYDAGVDLVHSTFLYSTDLKLFDELLAYVGKVARDKQAKDTGRQLILEKIQMLIPIAASIGRGQLIVLGGIKHALGSGGVRGSLWAPVTLYEYLRQGLKDLAAVIVQSKLDAMSGVQFHTEYLKLLADIKSTQRPKFEAFLLAFHRFLVICGFDPLPRKLTLRQEPLPPAASTVTAGELDLALQYIIDVAPNERVALQGRLGLVLAFWVPIRTIELWCIRVGDVHIKVPMFITLYPRARDGVGKTEATLHQEDLQAIDSPQLKSLLIDMVNARRDKDFADDEDYLLGRPGHPGERYEQLLTTKLMNDALKWASGDEYVTFYSLRHTAISRRASMALMETIDGD